MIFSKLRIAVGAAVVAVALSLGGALYYQTAALKKARSEALVASTRAAELESALAAEKRARVAQTIARRKAQAQLKESQDALNQTLKANPEWAAQPVPPDVADWVRQHGQDPNANATR